jgi:hypothetical protein
MNCPKCGYERQSRDDAFVPPGECPACGVVYAKHDVTNDSDVAVRAMPAPNLRPSPVDALSLRKARERVEKRLREQQRTRVQDDRHARTLELAKQLASEELRKRQEEWKQAQDDAVESAATDADAESQAPASEAKTAPADERLPDHQIQGADQAADDLMTTVAATVEETADSPALAEKPSSDRQSQNADQASDDLMTTAKADMEAAADSPTPSVEDAPEPAAEAHAAAAGQDDEAPQYGPDDAVESAPPDTDGNAADAETLPAATSLTEDPGTEIPESPDEMPAPHVAAAALSQAPKSGSKAGLSRLLPVVAWLILGAGVIGAILSWTTIREVEAGARLPMAEGLNSVPLGLLLGFAYLATGVLGFAFFWVSSLISTQLRDIHRLLVSAERQENTLRDEGV